MTEQDILFWLEDNYFTNPDAGIEIYYREDVIEKLLEMQKSIAELEKYNLDLANESHAKSERIAELEIKINNQSTWDVDDFESSEYLIEDNYIDGDEL